MTLQKCEVNYDIHLSNSTVTFGEKSIYIYIIIDVNSTAPFPILIVYFIRNWSKLKLINISVNQDIILGSSNPKNMPTSSKCW